MAGSNSSERYSYDKQMTGIASLLIKIILLVALAFGSTFALFTTSDEVGMSASAARMGVKLYRTDESLAGEYVEMAGAEGDAFEGLTWEPGVTRLVFVKVENGGTIPVDYMLRFIADMGELEGAFEYCAFEGDYSMLGELKESSWAELAEANEVKRLESNLGEDVGEKNSISRDGYVDLDVGDADHFVVAIHMKDGAGNNYQQKSCMVYFSIYAEQGNMR